MPGPLGLGPTQVVVIAMTGFKVDLVFTFVFHPGISSDQEDPQFMQSFLEEDKRHANRPQDDWQR